MAQGEYIAPEKIEVVLNKHEIVAQSFVYGDSLQSTLVGVVVPDELPFVAWCKDQGLGSKSFKELCADDKVRKAVQKVLQDYGRTNGLKGFEAVKAVYLETEPFSAENGILTPTFKLKVLDVTNSSVTTPRKSTAQKSMLCMRLLHKNIYSKASHHESLSSALAHLRGN